MKNLTKTKDRPKTEMQLINALPQPDRTIVKFLKKKGWKVVIAAGCGVVKDPNNNSGLNYWFIFRFMGKEPKELKE